MTYFEPPPRRSGKVRAGYALAAAVMGVCSYACYAGSRPFAGTLLAVGALLLVLLAVFDTMG